MEFPQNFWLWQRIPAAQQWGMLICDAVGIQQSGQRLLVEPRPAAFGMCPDVNYAFDVMNFQQVNEAGSGVIGMADHPDGGGWDQVIE